MQRNYDHRISQLLNISPKQVASTIRLLDEGNTIPFIARYRKEVTLNLDEYKLREVEQTVTRFRQVDSRRDTILASIGEQGKLTPQLSQKIEAAESVTELEDLYQPYKPKRRTRASTARDRGLEPLAVRILKQPRDGQPPEAEAQTYLNEEVQTVEEALAGARDIVAEIVTDEADVRAEVRDKALRFGTITCQRVKGSEDPKGTYKTYYEFENRLAYVKPHQTLALNRGESEKILRVAVQIAERDWRDAIIKRFRPDARSDWMNDLNAAIDDGAKRLLLPAIERDVRRQLTEDAESHAIAVFADNLSNLLSQPPLQNHVIMGVDPAFRTGCKIAVIDASSKVLYTETIYPHPPQKRYQEALQTLLAVVKKFKVTIIAIGNGTASRETEQLVAELTRSTERVQYAIVNEAGASVYSASDLARSELPDLDVSIRGAVSIARRLQDPLAELVKIDPRSIGVGLYQHDVNQTQLSETLDVVVESVVNQVGVDVNTASPALLRFVSGVGPKLAENIVAHRDEHGMFVSRTAIKAVSGMGAKSFEQAAGFLRINHGDNALDASAIHPESYKVARAVLKRAQVAMTAPPEARERAFFSLLDSIPLADLSAELGTGELTLADIMEQLVQPGRDPRSELDPPLLRSDVLSMTDLKPGMMLTGTVRNVVDFGAFIDVGVKQDGLLHISKIPRDVNLSVGDILEVVILNVDLERGRIALGWNA